MLLQFGAGNNELYAKNMIPLLRPFSECWGITAIVHLLVHYTFKQEKFWNSY